MLSPAIVDVFILPYEVILALWIVTNILLVILFSNILGEKGKYAELSGLKKLVSMRLCMSFT